MWAVLVLALQDPAKDLKQASDLMDKLKSYRFTLRLTVRGEEKLAVQGEFEAPDLLHLKSEKSESVQKGETRLVRAKDGSWREPLLKRHEDPRPPHAWVRKLADACPSLKKEKSSKIGPTTVDLYVHSLAHEAARGAFEAGGLPLWGAAPDWSRTKNGVVFYLGRDDLFRRVEHRSSDDKEHDTLVGVDFLDFNKAAVDVPPEVRERLGK